MNESELTNHLSKLSNQGNKLVLEYVRTQLTEEKPVVVFYVEHDYDSDPMIYFYLIDNETKENIISFKNDYLKLQSFFGGRAEEEILMNFNFADYVRRFNSFAIIEKDQVLVYDLVELKRKKSEWQLVKLKEDDE